jgi:hypothetical protein
VCNLSSTRLDVYSEQICATYSPPRVLPGITVRDLGYSSSRSTNKRALEVDDLAISISVSPAEQAASVHELTAEQVATSQDVEVEHVSLEDLTQVHVEGYASSRISVTVQLDASVVAYQDCPDFNDIFIMVHLIRNVLVWYAGKGFMMLGFFNT